MIRANRNNQRRAQRRPEPEPEPEHEEGEGEVVVEVEVADDQRAVEHQAGEEKSNFGESLKSSPEVDREAKKLQREMWKKKICKLNLNKLPKIVYAAHLSKD